MPDRSYRLLLWSLALVGLAADQASKYSVFAWLHEVKGHTYALFQTAPESRMFAIVPYDPIRRADQRGFFLEAAFQNDDETDVPPIPHVNTGALFGLLRDHPAANSIFAGISLIAAIAIIIWSSYRSTAADRWLCTALGLILAGTLGNFYDRVIFSGVRDFLHWNYLFDWPVFNIADCCLVVGACLLLFEAVFSPQQARNNSDEPKALTPAA